MAKLSKSKQDILIDKERKRILAQLAGISDDKKELARSLVDRVAFMKVILEILEDDIKITGPTYPFEQGVQKMIVENPSQKSYNTMINRYTTAFDKLINLLPKENKEEVGSDGFDDFVESRAD